MNSPRTLCVFGLGTHRICSAEIKELIEEIAKALGAKALSHIFPTAQAVAIKIAHNLQNIILDEVWIQRSRWGPGGVDRASSSDNRGSNPAPSENTTSLPRSITAPPGSGYTFISLN